MAHTVRLFGQPLDHSVHTTSTAGWCQSYCENALLAFGPQRAAGIDEFIPSPAWGRDMALVPAWSGRIVVDPDAIAEETPSQLSQERDEVGLIGGGQSGLRD
jgi:hypothetical protein